MSRGLFITLEGGEGCGKSSQILLLRNWLEQHWHGKVCLTREPGGTKDAEEIRRLLVTGAENRWDALTEILLMTASRRDNVRHLIKPALDRGEAVLSDRFFDSTAVYQGFVGGVNADIIAFLNQHFLEQIAPDITILLDLDPRIGLKRVESRVQLSLYPDLPHKGHKRVAGGKDSDEIRFEGKGIDFHEKVREGYLSLAKAEPARFIVIDASQDENAVHQAIITALKPRIDSARTS